MKPLVITTLNIKRRKAMALVMVVTTVALISMLIVAIFSLTRTEYKATQSFVAARSAKQLGDIGVAMVQAQIQNAQNSSSQTSPSTRTIHATQPGMVRVYKANGTFERAHKLYSSAQMVVKSTSESALYGQQHQVPQDWRTLSARYVDLNEPVVRPALQAGQTAVYFPVIDPRAAYNTLGSQTPSAGTPTTQVEGFTYSKKTASTGANPVTYQEVVLPDEVSDSAQLRLPMPVEWLYLLQDGTTGALDASNKFISSSNTTPSDSNPIVGRVAFWTDDESCKVNINTASEPTFMAPPFFYHERDRRWAHFPASSGEYQRYPGHPATVALSAVLAPGYLLDPLAPGYMVDSASPSASGLSQADVLDIKEYIYNMAPKVAQGGSLGGTVPFARDDFSNVNNEPSELSQLADTETARTERLYASVDELLFTNNGFDSTTGRSRARHPFPGSATRYLFDQGTLEKSRFFLTAHSRAPEFSMFGLPRVCIWPVADETLGDNMRNSFDNMIALCSTLASGRSGAAVTNSYLFRRANNRSQTVDLPNTGSGGLGRNSKLLDYLVSQMSGLTWPRSNLGSSTNFQDKYGSDNVKQLAVQFFDYVRCTNLYDGVIARDNNPGNVNYAALPSGSALYNHRDTQPASAKRTYTDQRITPPPTSLTVVNASTRGRSDDTSVFPGHGMVTPVVWNSGGQQYRGFGRMFTLSEIGINFICTADGRNDSAVSFKGNGGVASGGGAGVRVDPVLPMSSGGGTPTTNGYWYSNYPPLTELITAGNLRYGTVPTVGSPFHPSKHPGYNPENWNYTLAANTPLEPNEKRIQAIFLLESFCPSLGWTKFHPEYSIVVDGTYIRNIRLNNKTLFDTSGPIDVRSNGNLYEANNVHPVGGHAGPTAMVGGRGGRPVTGDNGANGPVMMGSDSTWSSGNPTGHNGLTNYGLTSNFVTVRRDQPLTLTFPGGDLKIEIYDTHNWQGTQPIQTIRVRFTGVPSTIPMPHLTGAENDSGGPRGGPFPNHYVTTNATTGQKFYRIAMQPPKFWCYNYSGCLGRQTGTVNPNWDGTAGKPFWLSAPAPNLANNPLTQSLRGRLDTSQIAVGFSPPGGALAFSIFPDETSDVTCSLVPAVGDYRMIAARYIVPPELWKPHPSWNGIVRQAHSFTNFGGNTEPGARLAYEPNDTAQFPVARLDYQMVAGVPYNVDVNGNPIAVNNGSYNSRQPDLPGDPNYASAANSFGDFDNGIASAREGPYINKPDEGNFFVGGTVERFNRAANSVQYRSGYFYESWKNAEDWRSGIFMTPNRIVSSPVMFGSLPTGVWNTGGNVSVTATSGTTFSSMPARPWQTLLFRPHARSVAQGQSRTKDNHPGEFSPRDHNLLDLFFMPVVEPYAISEPLSVAGRINLNYQIMPFTNIKRATGLHALMKGEYMTAIPNADATRAKTFARSTAQRWDEYWSESAPDRRFWHRPIDVTETLRQFDERFDNDGNLPAGSRGLFRSASQICEMHLIPADRNGTNTVNVNKPTRANNRQSAMDTFWLAHSVTGDNVRERPYSNLYSRVTTRSNTFRVHMRAQVIRKARSVAADTVDPIKDAIISEYRGSTLIERYIDPTDVTALIPDYAASSNPLSLPSLETFYKFRTLESKRFSP